MRFGKKLHRIPRRTFQAGSVLIASMLLAGCAVGISQPASDITHEAATLNGMVFNDQNGETSFWFRYGKTTAYGSETTHRSISIGDRGPHPQSESLSGLDSDSTYHFKLCAQDATPKAGPGCGKDQTFTTLPPTITDNATDVTGVAATLNGRIHPGGVAITYWFEYGTTSSYGHRTSTGNAGPGTSQVPVSERVTSLAPGTTYHNRLCTQRSAAQTCGSDVVFTTQSPGFREEVAIGSLKLPTAVRFAPDGRVFVGEKSGIVKVFDSLTDTTPTVFADLRTKVYNAADRGLTALELDPSFPSRPYVDVAYSHDALPGDVAPHYGTPGADSDPCFSPSLSCPSDARVSRLTAAGDQIVSEKVLVDNYCFQTITHAMDHLQFGLGRRPLRQRGRRRESRLPGLRTGRQPVRRSARTARSGPGVTDRRGRRSTLPGSAYSDDPAVLNGAIIRVDPDTGTATPSNPLLASPDANARRIVAHGLRNPFRFTFRPGTQEIWVGDVGWNAWEEIDRITDPTVAPVSNFGWPCYEGNAPQPGFDGANLDLCEDLYGDSGAVTAPYHSWSHADRSSRARPVRPAAPRSPVWRSSRPALATTRRPTTMRCSLRTTPVAAYGR